MKTFFLLALFLSGSAFADAPLIWNTSSLAKFLTTSGYTLNDGKQYISLSVDPTAGGGYQAPAGSIGVRNNAGAGELWLKTGAGATAWTLQAAIAVPISLINGGTNNAMTASNGGLVYSTASSLALSSVGTSGQAAVSGGAGSPTWFSPTQNNVVYAGAGGALSQNSNFTFQPGSLAMVVPNIYGSLASGGSLAIAANPNSVQGDLSLGKSYKETGATGQVKIGDIANATAFTNGVSVSLQASQAKPYISFEASGLSNPWIMDVSSSKWYFNRFQNDIGGFYLDTANHFGTGDGAPTYMVTFTNTGSANTDVTNFVALDPLVAIRNRSATNNNFSGIDFENQQSKFDSGIFGVHDNHSSSTPSGHLEAWVNNAGTIKQGLAISSLGTVSLAQYGSGIGHFDASGNLISSALVGADLPNPSSSTLGGIESFASLASRWINGISTAGVPTASQPAFTDISGVATSAQLPNATSSAIGGVKSLAATASQWIRSIEADGTPTKSQPAFTDISGSVSAAQLPNPSSSTLGGIQSFASLASRWINGISTSGVPTASQPDFTDISGVAKYSQGGTSLAALPKSGELLIGNSLATSGYSLGTLTAGSNITITNTPGGVSIAASGGGGGTPNVGQFYFGDDCGSWTTNSTTYVDLPGDNSCTFTTVTSTNLGTVDAYLNGGNHSDGIIFTPNNAGRFEVCAYPIAEVHGSIQAFAFFQLVNSAGTPSSFSLQTTDVSGATYTTSPLCTIENVSAGSALTYKLQVKVFGTSAAMSMGGTSLAGDSTVWTVKLVN